MCARYTAATPADDLALMFGLPVIPDGYVPRYNVAPGQPVPVVRRTADGGRELVALRWGLVPAWAKADTPQAAAGLVNARAESAAEKPAFRDAVRLRRCLVPADGFIEWETVAGKRQPYLFRPADGKPVAFAGLWEPAAPATTHRSPTVAILTVAASPDVAVMHDRMPAILRPAQFAAWLDPHAVDPLGLLAPLPAGALVSHPVSPAINRPAREGPELLEPVVVGLFG